MQTWEQREKILDQTRSYKRLVEQLCRSSGDTRRVERELSNEHRFMRLRAFSCGRGFTLLASFHFATSCPKIKVWCMRSNGILFLETQQVLFWVFRIRFSLSVSRACLVTCKSAKKWYLMRICISWLCPFIQVWLYYLSLSFLTVLVWNYTWIYNEGH